MSTAAAGRMQLCLARASVNRRSSAARPSDFDSDVAEQSLSGEMRGFALLQKMHSLTDAALPNRSTSPHSMSSGGAQTAPPHAPRRHPLRPLHPFALPPGSTRAHWLSPRR